MRSFILLAAVASLFSGCGGSLAPNDTASDAPATPFTPPTAPPIRAPDFPALSRDGDIYVEAADLYRYLFSYHNGALASRYVLYRDSTFGLQFSSPRFGFFEYAGRRYTRAQSVIRFDWDGSGGQWQTTAALRGDTLTVRYSLMMQMSDFVDGDYVRLPTR